MDYQQEQALAFTQAASKILVHEQVSTIRLAYTQDGNRNLIANKLLKKGETIFQVGYDKMLTRSEFMSSKFAQYLHSACAPSIPTWKILGEYDSDLYIKQLIDEHSEYYILPMIYFFEKKYLHQGQDSDISSQWMNSYVECLPYDYSMMPHHYNGLIEGYHPDLARTFSAFAEALHHSYEFLKDIIYGRNTQRQYSFQAFLESIDQDWQYLYQNYCQQFTYDQYQWAFLTWKTRAFDKLRQDKHTETIFVPIIDMINHSSSSPNAAWQFVQSQKLLRLTALEEISCGEQLFINYGEREMQQFFADYGFVNGDEKCLIVLQSPNLLKIQCLFNPSASQEQFTLSLKEKLVENHILSSGQLMNELQHKLFGETAARKQRLFELQKNHTSKVLNTEERSVLSQLELILQRELQTLEKMEISLNLLVQSFV